MAELAQHLINSVVLGSVYVFVALGITLIFGLTRLVNFAHGEFLAIAAMAVWALRGDHLGFWATALIAVVLVAALAYLVERTVFRPTFSVPVNGFIISLGLLAISQALQSEVVGVLPRSIDSPLSGAVHLGPTVIQYSQVVLVGATAACLAGLMLVLSRTSVGRRVRASSEDDYAARLSGINVTRTVSLVFVAGSTLAGVAGALMITLFAISPYSGLTYVLKGFIAAVVGGLGNVKGAAVAGLLLAVIEELGGAYISLTWQSAFPYTLLVLVMILRPAGLFGRAGG